MLQVTVYNEQQHEQFTCSKSTFALRKSGADPTQWTLHESPSTDVEEKELLLRFACDGKELVTQDGASKSLPYLIYTEETWIEIVGAVEHRTLEPLKNSEMLEILRDPCDTQSFAGPSAATVGQWLTHASQLHRFTPYSPDFFRHAARLAVDSIGLDSAFVLRRNPKSETAPWEIAGSFLKNPEHGIAYESDALKYLEGQNVAWYQPTLSSPSSSNTVVVAPVREPGGQLSAVIYGVRDRRGESRRKGIRPLEARLIQLLAESVAVGISRQEKENEAARARLLLEHAFSTPVAEHIQKKPECLAGQLREVTLLFADMRGFTSLAESLSPQECYDLLSDVMEQLSQVVLNHEGIVVDYYGDGLLALWNAPLEQTNHADLACHAATKMFDVLPQLNKKWQDKLGRPIELGIGVHTGQATVGNAGTRNRIKYGPRGNTVNVANRVQLASKQLELPLVVSSGTQAKLSGEFFSLRICRAKLPDLEQPIDLFSVYPAAQASRMRERLDEYAWALELFESGCLNDAEQLLEDLVQAGEATPAHFLAQYTAIQKKKNFGRRAVDKYIAAPGSIVEILAK